MRHFDISSLGDHRILRGIGSGALLAHSWPAVILIFLCSFTSCQSQKAPGDEMPDLDIDACLTQLSDQSLDIVTWNLRNFPMDSFYTVEQVARFIAMEDADIVAFQEIQSEEDFNHMMYQLPEWGSEIIISSGLNLGYIYKKSEVALVRRAGEIFPDDHFAFPRPPVVMDVVHTNGIEVMLINLHLKCCDGDENELRRREASEKLKDFIDVNYPGDPVMVLGDFNDEISGIPDNENVFINFINDAANYRFADMEIAAGPIIDWSYPSYPSHIDHILITNELFQMAFDVQTLAYDHCDGRYFRHISDHRPVMISLTY
jgi:endonuclease/exonuclease/phosphatase family metal-dependent hydrolase